jgi:Flp pilus assembly protein TadB
MKRLFLLFVVTFLFAFSSFAAGVANTELVQTNTYSESQFENAKAQIDRQLSEKKLSLKDRFLLKVAQKKIQKIEKAQGGDIKGLLTTLGLVFMIIGLVLLVLGLIGIWGFANGLGLFIVGLILYLVAKYAL